jgi:hypothetical protein
MLWKSELTCFDTPAPTRGRILQRFRFVYPNCLDSQVHPVRQFWQSVVSINLVYSSVGRLLSPSPGVGFNVFADPSIYTVFTLKVAL